MSNSSPIPKLLAYAVAVVVSLVCLYPYWWMLVSAFRSSQARSTWDGPAR